MIGNHDWVSAYTADQMVLNDDLIEKLIMISQTQGLGAEEMRSQETNQIVP